MTTIRRKGTALAGALALTLSLAACGSQTDRLTIDAATVGSAPGFSPDTLTVEKENSVRLRVGNDTAREHGFSIEGYRIERVVQPDQTVEVRFRASRGGTFKIYCQLHPTHQTGTLVVR